MTSSTDILERPDVRDSDTGKSNEVFHYVKKNKIAESAVMGTMVEALCGEVFPVTKSPKPGARSARRARRSTTSSRRTELQQPEAAGLGLQLRRPAPPAPAVVPPQQGRPALLDRRR